MNSLGGPGWPPYNKARQWNVHQVSRNLGKISVMSNSGRKQAEVLPLPTLGKGKMFLKGQNRFEPITIDLPHKSQRKIDGLGSNSWSFSLVSFPGGSAGKEPGSQCRRRKRGRFSPQAGKTPWRRKRQTALVFLPGKFHGYRRLVGYSPWGHRELDMTDHTQTHTILP